MDIVDAQLHFGPAGKTYGPGLLEAESSIVSSTLEGMNTLGIRSAMIDEYWFWVKPPKPKQNLPGYELPNGAWRASFPLAQLASALHPDRFSTFVRIDRNDPQLESVMRVLANTQGVRAFRVLPIWSRGEAEAFVEGNWSSVFAIAEELGLPICCMVPGFVEYLPQYAKRFPRLQFLVDHWGMGIGLNSSERPDDAHRRSMTLEYLDEILKLSEHPNIALKIGHAQMHFKSTVYPFPEVRPRLRRAINAFGSDRLIWASDKTVAYPPISWSELLYSLKDDPELSLAEKEAMLGGNARRIFNWPAA